MSASCTSLANGLTVAVDPMPGAESVAVGLYAAVGSRSEPEQLSGLAHLVEHMVFKGAGGRDTRAIAEAIEDVGGVAQRLDRARPDGLPRPRRWPRDAAARRRADRRPRPRAALRRRRISSARSRSILSELGEAVDAPDDLVHDHLFEAAFADQPLGRSVLGASETIRGDHARRSASTGSSGSSCRRG